MGDGSVGLILDVDGIADFRSLSEVSQSQSTHIGRSEEVQDLGDEYIIFTLPSKGIFSFHLSEIYRLEELPTKNFTKVTGKLSTIYRDTVTPLFFVHEQLGIKPNTPLLERENKPPSLSKTMIISSV